VLRDERKTVFQTWVPRVITRSERLRMETSVMSGGDEDMELCSLWLL